MMKAPLIRHFRMLALSGALFVAPEVTAGLVFEASLKNGDYGGGTQIDTLDPLHGGSPHVLGIVDTPEGVYFTSTESDGRSNGLINYPLGAARTSFLQSGTIAMSLIADRETHVSGNLFGDNYGYNAFRNGQGAFEARASRVANGEGPADDQVRLTWNVLHPSPITWYFPVGSADEIDIEYGESYELGFTWGGPEHDFELWIDGELAGSFDLPSGIALPWGVGGSATNLGLGSNHERGYGTTGNYASTPGVTYSNLRIWDEYRAFGDTTPCAKTPPQLSVARGGKDTVVLSWPDCGDRFVLQESSTLQPSAWSVAGYPIQKVGATLRVILTEVTGKAFFRLIEVEPGGPGG